MTQQIINGDCLVEIDKIPDSSIDMVLTDPPYGDGIGYGRFNKEIANNEDESINYKILPKIYEKMREGGVCYLFTNWKFSPLLQEFLGEKTLFNIRMQLVIVKNNFGMGYGFRNQYELCLVLEKGKVKYNRADVSNVLNMQYVAHKEDSHPHQKGVELLKMLISHSTKEGDTVLDCFLGSGSTLVACKQMNRNGIGIELDKKWCDLAQTRLDKSTDSLF